MVDFLFLVAAALNGYFKSWSFSIELPRLSIPLIVDYVMILFL